MATVNNPAELRLFISSTFHDLQAERGYLMKHVFPKLRAILRERGAEFTEIDLRWGVTEEEASLGKVIRTCLEEIENCKPYFLGLLGDRYGWVPHLADVQKDYQLLQRYPWIEDAVLDGASLVELEFMAGILLKPEEANAAFVYARESQSPHKHERERLASLRQKIEQSGRPVTTFESVEQLGEMVYESLLAVIERDWPKSESQSPLEVERSLHEAFAATRRKAYIANPKYYKSLQEHAAKGTQPLIVHGNSGAGKSALMSYFAAHYRRTNASAFVVSHFVGSTPSGSDALSIMRHILGEIRERYAILEELPETKEQLEQLLPTWLARVQNETMLLIIDAVNQLPEPDNLLGWLPEYMPPNVRLLVTTTPGASHDSLKKLGWPELHIRPLDSEEREALIVRFLGEYHKGLNREQLQKISHDHKSSSPLFLRTLLEELRLSGEFELLDATIDHYLSARDINELFQLILERMENDYGRDLVANVMSYIRASRHGLSEPELIEITRMDRLHLSTLLLALDYHLMKPNGRYAFFHDYLRQAVTKRYMSNPNIARERHRSIGTYFSHQAMTSRRISEELWQYQHAGEKHLLLNLLLDPQIILHYGRQSETYELLRYWNSLNQDAGALLSERVNEWREKEGHESWQELSLATSKFLFVASFYKEALGILDVLLLNLNDDEKAIKQRVDCLMLRSSLLDGLGYFDQQESEARELVALCESIHGGAHPQYAESLRILATQLYRRKELSEAEQLLRKAVAVYDKVYGFTQPKKISTLSDLGAILLEKGKFKEARELFSYTLTLAERSLGREHPDTAQILNSLAVVCKYESDYVTAVDILQRAVAIDTKVLGDSHPTTAEHKINLAVCLQSANRSSEAIEMYDNLLRLFTKRFGDTDYRSTTIMNNLGLIYMANGDLIKASDLLQGAAYARAKSLGPNHPDTSTCWFNFAKALTLRGQLAQAQNIYQQHLPNREQALGVTHPFTQLIYREYLELLRELGAHEEHERFSKRVI